MWSFAHLLVLLLMTSASAISSALAYDRIRQYSAKCKWRFHECEPKSDSSDCQVRFRRWCRCVKYWDRDWCPRRFSMEANWTAAEEILRSAEESQGIGDFCRQSNCTVVPGKCSWTSWGFEPSSDPCRLQSSSRYRALEPCCHPFFSSWHLNISCGGKREKQVRLKPSRITGCLPWDPTGDQARSRLPTRWIIFVVFAIIVIGGGMIIVWYRVIKIRCLNKPRSPNRRNIDLTQQERLQAKDIIIPQPGQPLPQTFL